MEVQTVPAAKRRNPNQARARDKLELIYEASIRILNKQGLEGFTTNRIAEVAGISIGTLYQYFSNKQEILVALGEREIQETIGRITKAFFQPNEEKDKLRLLVRAFLNTFDGRNQVRKILLDLVLSQRGILGLDQSVSRVLGFVQSPMASQLLPNVNKLTELDLFVLSSAVTGVIRSALVRDVDMLTSRDLEDRIVILVRGYIAKIGVEPTSQESFPNDHSS